MDQRKYLIPRHPFFTGFEDFFTQPSFMMNDFAAATPSFLTDMERQAVSVFTGSSSSLGGYQISNTDKEFRLTMDVPGVKAKDMNLQLEGGERVIHLYGGRKFQREGTVTESKFERSFTIDPTSVDTSKITANLADGVLVVTAPKREEHKNVRKIAITERPHSNL